MRKPLTTGNPAFASPAQQLRGGVSASFLQQRHRVMLKVKPSLAVGIVGVEAMRLNAVLTKSSAESPCFGFAEVNKGDLPFTTRGAASNVAGSLGHTNAFFK
jgi:hypothetical protein